MKNKILFLFLLVILKNTSVYSQPLSQKHDYKSDIDYFSSHLISGHKNLFANISKVAFDSLINDLKNRAGVLTQEEFIVELFRINARIADEHTRIDPGFENIFPFRFEYFDEGLAIILADSLSSKYLSCRVLAIDHHQVQEVISKLSSILKKDNPSFIKFWMAYYCNKPQLLYGLGLIENQQQASFRLLTATGDTITAIVPSIPVNKVTTLVKAEPLNHILPYMRDDFYWYQYDTTHNTMYFDYAKCSEDDKLSFNDFNTNIFREIELRKPSKLVVDLRFNGGGNSSVLHPFLKNIKGNYLNTKGKLYVLVGRKTFSSALMNAVDFVKNTNAIIVGEPTGANINHFGEVKSFQLPDSKITVYYSTKFWNNWPGHNGPLVPDIAVSHSYFDFLNGKDEAMEYILKQ
ncbi:MAG: hypothetical protein IPO83_14715 [Chitinophagaceae bacterium]|nr:hypothetical protein [Chitinophagaceae bacterium]